tara:strand:- start:19131 stop:19904 length:774 start_codon:yes stop_codon:yes gene_type:complete
MIDVDNILNNNTPNILEKSIESYYKSIIDLNNNFNNYSGVYNYIVMEENTNVITTDQKTRKMRDLTIEKIENENINNDKKIDSKIEKLNNKIVVPDDDAMGYMRSTFKSKNLKKLNVEIKIDFNFPKKDMLNMLFREFTKIIDDKILDLIKNINVKNVTNSMQITQECNILYHINRVRPKIFGEVIWEKRIINRLNIGYNKILILPEDKPIILSISDVSLMASPIDFSKIFRLNGFLDIIADPSECQILLLSEDFIE